VVAVPTFGDSRDEMRHICEQAEVDSGKNKFKWGKARPERRLEYLRLIFADKRFKGCLRYAVFYDTDYDTNTVTAIAKAVLWNVPDEYTSLIYVDGLSKTKRAEYMRDLRNEWGVQVRQLRGVAKDENEALVRLADAIAGFVRDILTGSLDALGEAQALYEKGTRSGFLVEL
jgi:hypothetical protein